MKLTDMQRDRAVGALIGLAAGTALGAGYEFTIVGPVRPYAWTVRPASSAHDAETILRKLDEIEARQRR